jgi:hypothetical protein
MRGRRAVWCGVVVALLAAVGCSASEEPSDTPTTSEASSATATESASEPAAGGCVVAQRRAASSLGMWRVEGSVPYGPGRGSETARDALERLVAKVSDRLTEKCGAVPPEYEAFVADVAQPLAAELFGDRQYRQTLEAWLAWGESVGATRRASEALEDQRECAEQMHPLLDVTYDLTSTPTGTGWVWFLEATFDNRTGRVLDGSWSGSMRGTSVLPDPFGLSKGPRPGDGRGATLHWGGSSADSLQVRPGVSTRLVAPDADTDVHTTEDGRLRVLDFTAGLVIRGTRVGCSVVLRPGS